MAACLNLEETKQISQFRRVRMKGVEPSRLLGTTTSRLRVYHFTTSANMPGYYTQTEREIKLLCAGKRT